jgi:hypothetical protein
MLLSPGFNVYEYAHNDPVNLKDPTGHCPPLAFGIALGGAELVNADETAVMGIL